MDPYDDYDPTAYYYNTADEQDSDSEGDVIFAEAPPLNSDDDPPFWASHTGTSSSQQLRMLLSSTQNSTFSQTQEEEVASSGATTPAVPRRERRRKRYLEQRRQLLQCAELEENEHEDSEEEEEGNKKQENKVNEEEAEEEEEEDVFASIRSYLDRKELGLSQQDSQEEEGCDHDNAKKRCWEARSDVFAKEAYLVKGGTGKDDRRIKAGKIHAEMEEHERSGRRPTGEGSVANDVDLQIDCGSDATNALDDARQHCPLSQRENEALEESLVGDRSPDKLHQQTIYWEGTAEVQQSVEKQQQQTWESPPARCGDDRLTPVQQQQHQSPIELRHSRRQNSEESTRATEAAQPSQTKSLARVSTKDTDQTFEQRIESPVMEKPNLTSVINQKEESAGGESLPERVGEFTHQDDDDEVDAEEPTHDRVPKVSLDEPEFYTQPRPGSYRPPQPPDVDGSGMRLEEEVVRQREKRKRQKKHRTTSESDDDMSGELLMRKERMMEAVRRGQKRQRRRRTTTQEREENEWTVGLESQSSAGFVGMLSLMSQRSAQHHQVPRPPRKGHRGPPIAAGVKNAKSIVGSRPGHWGPVGAHQGSQESVANCSAKTNHGLSSRAAALSQATKSRTVRPGLKRKSTAPLSNASSSTNIPPPTQPPVRPEDKTDSAREPSPSQLSQQTEGHVSASSSRWEPNANVRKMSFGPAFLTKGGSNPVLDHVQDVPGGDTDNAFASQAGLTPMVAGDSPRPCLTPPSCGRSAVGGRGMTPFSGGSSGASDYARNSNCESGCQTLRRRPTNGSARKRKKAGPLMKQLRSIRGSIGGDWVRLQSGTYPFRDPSKRGMNVSDPRNRAASYIDVTMLGVPVPWVNAGQRLTVLGYVHRRVLKKKRGDAGGGAGDAGIGDLSGVAGAPTSQQPFEGYVNMHGEGDGNRLPHYAWMCFTYETAQEQRIGRGVQLRIYDTVAVPTRCGTGNEDALLPKAQHPSWDCSSFPTILCTNLCEPYPDILPPLPEVTPAWE